MLGRDSLTDSMRKMLTYPEQIAPNSARMVYAFVALADLKGPPVSLEYTIKSLSAPLQLSEEPRKKAAALGLGFVG